MPTLVSFATRKEEIEAFTTVFGFVARCPLLDWDATKRIIKFVEENKIFDKTPESIEDVVALLKNEGSIDAKKWKTVEQMAEKYAKLLAVYAKVTKRDDYYDAINFTAAFGDTRIDLSFKKRKLDVVHPDGVMIFENTEEFEKMLDWVKEKRKKFVEIINREKPRLMTLTQWIQELHAPYNYTRSYPMEEVLWAMDLITDRKTFEKLMVLYMAAMYELPVKDDYVKKEVAEIIKQIFDRLLSLPQNVVKAKIPSTLSLRGYDLKINIGPTLGGAFLEIKPNRSREKLPKYAEIFIDKTKREEFLKNLEALLKEAIVDKEAEKYVAEIRNAMEKYF